MMIAPIVASFYYFGYNYALKLFLDIMTDESHLTYQSIIFPLALFSFLHITLESVWRLSDIVAWKAEPYVKQSILAESYDYLQHHSYAFFQNNFTGALSSKVKGLLDGYEKLWAAIHHGILPNILNIVVNLSALFFVNVRLGLYMCVWGTVYVPIMYRLSNKLNELSFVETESRHDLIGQISDKIMNIISLFSFSARKRELQSLNHQIAHDFIPKQMKVFKYYFKLNIVVGLLYVILFNLFLFYTVNLKMKGLISIGDFAFIFGIELVVVRDIWKVSSSLQEFSRTLGDFKSSLSILNVSQENLDILGAKPLKIKTPKIEFRNFSFTYKGGDEVFKNLNLTIKPGENVGLVGESGAGKSSLTNLLLRYFESQKGEILIDGKNINNVTQDSLRENIAVIPQDTMLFHRTLMENIRYGNPDATEEQVIAACKKAHIHDFIMGLPEKYNAYVGERGIKLSGGQRQRIAIARAILKHAPILILDEATSALDSQTEKYIQEGLSFFLKDKKNTVIAIAHRLSTLKHMDRIIVLDKGKVVEEGTHDELIRDKKSLYSKLWKLQEI